MKKFFIMCCLLLLLFSCKTKETEKTKEENKVKSDKTDIISYVIKNTNGGEHYFTIDNTKGTLTLTLPNDHSVSLNAVTPTIVVAKGASISPASGEVQDFSSDKTVTYTVTAESGATKTFTASVKVLPARGTLMEESIMVYEATVQDNSALIDEKYAKVEKTNIKIKFKGDNVPTEFTISPERLDLNSKGDSGTITLSTEQNDYWNVWSKTITVKRGGDKAKASKECLMKEFRVGEAVGTIDQNAHTVKCALPADMDNKKVVPTIKCSDFAAVSPSSGEAQDFSNGAVTYTVTAEDGQTKTMYSVTVEKGKSNLAKITEFKIGEVKAKIDDENGTITAEVEKTVELSTIAPTIEVSPGAKVNPTSGTSQNFTNSVEYTVTAEDGSTTKKYTVTITHKKSDEAKIKSFKAQNASGIINEKTILVMLPFESQISSSIAPIIEVSEGAKVSPQSGVAQDFSNGKVVKYTVTSESGKVTSNYDVVVKRILPKTNISIFNEEVHFNPGEDGKGTVAIDKDKEEIKPTDITITYEDNGTKTVPHSQISIADGKDAPKWVGGKMMLKIILNLGQEYITGSMLIEVSKKA